MGGWFLDERTPDLEESDLQILKEIQKLGLLGTWAQKIEVRQLSHVCLGGLLHHKVPLKTKSSQT
jgi:hypothetical protein